MSENLSTSEFRELLAKALPGATDADTEEPRLDTFFTPHQHRRALEADVSIVLGGRGVGKTWWFKALLDEELRAAAAERYDLPELGRIDCKPGFGTLMTDLYPGPRVLHDLIDRKSYEAEDVWMAVALFAFGYDKIRELTSWSARVEWVRNSPSEVEAAIVDIDARHHRAGMTGVLLFDALDRLNSDRALANQLANGILRLALSFRTTTRNLRVKVFMRNDMFESAGLQFADASKLTNNRIALEWDAESLYSLLFHLMAGADHDCADTFKADFGWHPGKEGSPRELVLVLNRIASEFMGRNFRKGRTYSWIPKHLADGHGQTSPRSFLSALGEANSRSQQSFSDHEFALHWDAIREGVRHASGIRVREVTEDTPWVVKALDPLNGEQVPIEAATVHKAWAESGLDDYLRTSARGTQNLLDGDDLTEGDDQLPTGPSGIASDSLISELIELGIFSRRLDGRLDLPDVYRLAFEIGRKGGVPLRNNLS